MKTIDVEIRIYDAEMQFLGLIENETSFQWNRKYNEPGSFELHCPITESNGLLLKRSHLVWKREAAEAGVIESLELKETVSGNEIIAKGRFLSAYMDRRLIRPFYKINDGLVEEAMREILVKAAPIPRVEPGEKQNYTERVTFQATYRNLLKYEEKLARFINTGFRFRPDFVSKKIFFELYRGIDHSVHQDAKNRVIFSDEYGNLTEADYVENDQLFKNVCYVGGQGEEENRTIVVAGDDTLSGLERREEFISATDITQEGITDQQYKEALKQRGVDQLKKDILASSMECSVNPYGNFSYEEDYDLGDIVTIRKAKFGIEQDMRLTEVYEIYERGIYKIRLTFGSPLPTAVDWSDQ